MPATTTTRHFCLALAAFAALLAMGAGAAASGDTPTPTAEPTPAVSPTPTASPVFSPETSTIGIRFVSAGQPLSVGIAGLPTVLADGNTCPIGGLDLGVNATEALILWPRFPNGIPSACSKGPPTTIDYSVTTELGKFSVTLVWTGSDAIETIDIGESSPTHSPAQFPSTGGSTDYSTRNVMLQPFALFAISLLALSALVAGGRALLVKS